MHNSNQERQDQSMEDSTTMTIEFLRARLLSERSVSRSARQRAEELANRVAELEEQLKIVSLQRKKAEKATVDVLAILENNGISDISEAYYSSSDHETPCESKVGNNSTKEDERSVNSDVRKNGLQEFSGSDLDFSSVSGSSLSWKGRSRKVTSHAIEKYKDPVIRRQSSLASIGSSSSKHHRGKSCRQIRRRESRSVGEECTTDPNKAKTQENGIATCSELFPDCSSSGPEIQKEGSELLREKGLPPGSHPCFLEHDRNARDNDIDVNGYGGDKAMEKALEHQAQLIGQYEAMENAQREWEEKFRENNNSTPDSCDPRNHSDVTETRDEIKTQALDPTGTVSMQAQVSKLQAERIVYSKEFSKSEGNGFPHISNNDIALLQHQESTSSPASTPPVQDFAFPMAKEKENKHNLENLRHPLSHSSHHNLRFQVSPTNYSAHVISSNMSSSLSKCEASGNRNEAYALVQKKTPHELGGVLQSLEQAKISLQQKLKRLPLVESGTVWKAVEPSDPTVKTRERAEIPVGIAGLFRLPTDFLPEVNEVKPLSSGSLISLANGYAETGVTSTAGDHFVTSPYRETQFITTRDQLLATDQFVSGPSWDTHRLSTSTNDRPVAGDRFFNSPYMDTRSTTFTNDRLIASQYLETGSNISTTLPYVYRDLDTGVSYSSRHTFSTYPSSTYPSYPDMSRRPPDEGLSRPPPSSGVGMRPSDQFSFKDDHIRPNVYR
ncbi:hypothetical protein CFOL_v3_33718 [Cephalotus follicularis]|uniref:Uncharacterized protein n=1 Tax=Cephalotus follicularis TaxID=3775 RepID=A0A1Q3DD03_CEPFO|nr:hypothetical protein CFOL_v3_33718 [Cephalotus follicularis]